MPLSGNGDEVDQLAATFNRMLERIQTVVEGMEETNDNIAHELRSPVTLIERHIVACYDAADGGHFKAHRANTTRGTAHRRFAVSINLNTPDFAGGELWFPEFGAGGDRRHLVQQRAGEDHGQQLTGRRRTGERARSLEEMHPVDREESAMTTDRARGPSTPGSQRWLRPWFP